MDGGTMRYKSKWKIRKNWREYRQKIKDAQRTVIKAKNEAWQKTGEEIEKSMGNTRANKAWKMLKNMKKNKITTMQA